MIIIDNTSNGDEITQDYYKRLFQYYSKLDYKANLDKFKVLGSIIIEKVNE